MTDVMTFVTVIAGHVASEVARLEQWHLNFSQNNEIRIVCFVGDMI
jgi:hypothetical protein